MRTLVRRLVKAGLLPLLLLLLTLPARGADQRTLWGTQAAMPSCSFLRLNWVYVITDSGAADCTTGGGSGRQACYCSGTTWTVDTAYGSGGGGGGGTVTSVDLTVPSYFVVTGNPVTTTGTLAVAAATGQTSHRVLGTCGAGTSLSLCALVLGDLPTDWALATNTITGNGTASRCARFDSSHHLIEFGADCTTGTVTSVGMTVPSYFTVTGNPITTTGTLAVTATTGQTSHRVLGTCGSGTVLSVCALVLGDLPTDWALSTNTVTGNGTASRAARFDSSHHLVEGANDVTAGTVTSVTCGTGLSGGTITSTGTCATNFGTTSTTSAAGNSTTNGPSGTKYDPDRRPTGCDNGTSVCDEFIGGFQQTWQQFSSQHGETFTAAQDTALLTDTAAVNSHIVSGHVLTAPTGVNWIACTKLKMFFNSTNTQGGLIAEVGGTLTSPTRWYAVRQTSNTTWDTAGGTPPFTNGASSSAGNLWLGGSGPLLGDPSASGNIGFTYVYMRMRYVQSTKVLTYGVSNDGLNWKEAISSSLVTSTVASDPLYLGLWLDDASTTNFPNQPLVTPYIRAYYFRILTDATSTASPYPCGQ